MKNKFQPKTILHLHTRFLTLFFITLLFFSCNKEESKEYGDVKAPVTISPDIPVDVDPELQKELKAKDDNFYELNQAFNKHSWSSFVAIFWPRDKDGKAMPKFTDEGKATWLGWKEAFQVYRKDGGVPSPWGSERTGGGLGLDPSVVGDQDARVFLTSETPTSGKSKNIADEEDQAFAGELFDQNGNTVVYEVLMNKAEYDYLVANKLYNINGQIDFTSKNQIANFPQGDFKTHVVGATEIKFAWKVLEDTDHKERYYQSKGYVVDPVTKKLVKKDLGMIGFHISQKTPTGKQWVWSTFEHIDNLDQNTIEKDGKQTPIHPSLTDPNCEICPVNINVVDTLGKPTTKTYNESFHSNYWLVHENKTKYYANSKVFKTQSKRMVDIPVRVQELNKQMQAFFKSQGSVFQYYQLIDTQYPTDQDVPPGNHTSAGYKLPESVTNKAGGNPNITLLTNITMETFFQNSNELASNLMETDSVTGKSPSTDIFIFGTESCIGCHSSAGIYNGIDANGNFTTRAQLSGDFSWLLTQKAQWDVKIPRKLVPPPPPPPKKK
jgi:hypothetical protein